MTCYLARPIIPSPFRPAIALKPSRSRFLPVRGLRYHLREWGEPGAPLLVLLHGWMDVSASFQFVVRCVRIRLARAGARLARLRLTERGAGDCYWFPDYLGDLDAILDAVSAGAPVIVVATAWAATSRCCMRVRDRRACRRW